MARVRRSRGEWKQLIGAFEASRMSASAFAAQRGVCANTLRWWRCALRRESRAITFVDVVEDEAVADPFVVVVSAGHRVVVPRGFDGVELRRLVDALC